mgnify:CR=1 FL=1
MFFASLQGKMRRSVLFVLDDADEAGYFYHDLTQMMGQEKVFFFPSSYRRAVKYGQRDAANEILRTEVLARLSSGGHFPVVTYPDALAELVVAKQNLDERILKLTVGQQIAQTDVVHTLRDFELKETDYVYEPGLASNGEIGQGLRTTFPKIVAHELNLPLEKVFYDHPDTSRVPDSGPTVASRSLMTVGELLRRAAIKLRTQWKDGEDQIVEEKFVEPDFMIPFYLDKFRGDA